MWAFYLFSISFFRSIIFTGIVQFDMPNWCKIKINIEEDPTLTPKQNAQLVIKQVNEVLEKLSSHNSPQVDCEGDLGNIVGLFCKLIDENTTNSYPKLKELYNHNKSFCSAIRHINNCYKHNIEIVIVERNQPITLDVSKLDGPDTLGGSTKWNIDPSKDDHDKNQQKKYKEFLHGHNVTESLKKMKVLMEKLSIDLQ